MNTQYDSPRNCEHEPELYCGLHRCIKDCCKPQNPEYRQVDHPLGKVVPKECPWVQKVDEILA